MSEEERIWANALSDAIEPANEYARKIKDRYLVTAKNDMYGIDDEHHQPGISRRSGTPSRGLHGKA